MARIVPAHAEAALAMVEAVEPAVEAVHAAAALGCGSHGRGRGRGRLTGLLTLLMLLTLLALITLITRPLAGQRWRHGGGLYACLCACLGGSV